MKTRGLRPTLLMTPALQGSFEDFAKFLGKATLLNNPILLSEL
jgi:hypothetical protein